MPDDDPYAEAYTMLTGHPYPERRPGVSILPITQDEAQSLALALGQVRNHSSNHYQRAVVDRAVQVLKCAVTLTDVAPFAQEADGSSQP